MNESSLHIIQVLFRTTVGLGAMAVVVRFLLWLFRPHSPLIHRFAWACVLLQGLVAIQWTLDVPWYEAPVVSEEASVGVLPTLDYDRVEHPPRASSPSDTASPVPNATSWSMASTLLAIWICGIGLLFGMSLCSYLLLLVSLRTSRPPASAWREQWQGLLDQHGIRSRIPLRMHNKLGPMLCRLPRGYCVVCPEELWAEFSPVQRQTILQHELAHFQRGDIWKSLAVRLLALPHWFNPFSWWAVAKFEEGGEWACDQQLAAADPRQLPQFARALLEIVEPRSRQICASSARGSSLTIRLRRLLAFQVPEDSLMKRSLLTLMLLCLGGLGVFRLHLVAREPGEGQRPRPATNIAAEMQQFAARIHSSDSPLMQEVQRALGTPAGRIVLQDRIAHVQAELQNDARDEAVPRFLEERFRRDGQRLVLREGQKSFRDELLETAMGFNEDVARMMPTVHELAEKVSDDTDLDRLVARFLKHDHAPTMLYVEQLRQRLRPDVTVVERVLGQVFARSRDGKYIIRPGRRAEAEEFLDKMQQVLEGKPRVQEELLLYADDFAEGNELDRQVKQAMAEPMFSMLIASKILGKHEGSPSRRLNQFFHQLEELAIDTGDGLSVRQEQQEEVQELLSEYRTVRAVSQTLAVPVRKFAEQIQSGRPLEDRWRKVLISDLALMRLAEEMELTEVDPGEAVRRLLGQVLREGDDGRLHVRTDESEEEVAEFVRELFRMYREVRRRGRVIDEQAELLADTELRDALRSMGGKFVIIDQVQRSLRGAEFDGLSVWVEHHFEDSDDGWMLRPEAEQEVHAMLRDVAELKKELAKDDF